MSRSNVSKLTIVLSFTAAALAFGAATVTYVRHHELAFTPIGGGLFMLALGWAAWSRNTPSL